MTVDRLVAKRRPVVSQVALALLVLAAYSLWYCALFSPILFEGMLFPSDGQLAAFFTPIRLWNPLPLAGMPGLAEPHLAQLYPLRWLFAAFPHAIGFNFFVLFSYALASSLTFGYIYTITRSKLAAAAGGLVFGTSGYMIGHLGHTGLFAAVAWMPLTLWSLEKLRLDRSANWFAIAALSVAMTILAGHPQAFVYSIYLGAAYAIFLGSTATMGWLRYAALYVAVVGTGAAIAAAHIFPMLELAELSVRSKMTFDSFKEYALPLNQLSMLLFPYLYGGGFPPTFPLYFGQWNVSEIAGYAGLLTLMLAAVGAVCSWRSRIGAFWIGVAAVSFLLALGDATPLLRITYYLPAIDKLRAPARHFQETTFAIAVLAALGVDALQRQDAGHGLVRKIVAGAAAVMAISLCLIFAFYDEIEALAHAHNEILPSALRNPALWIPVSVFTLSALALLHWVRNPQSVVRNAALIIALAIDLGSYAWFEQWRYGTPVSFLNIPRYAEQIRADLLKERQRVMPMLGWQEPALAFSTVMSQLYDIPSVGGYGPLLLRRYAQLSTVTNGGWIDPAVLFPANRAPDLLAARYIVAPWPAPMTANAGDGARWGETDLPIALGAGCGANNGRHLRLILPEELRFDEIAIVSRMSCSTAITQGEAVVNLSLIDGRGNTQLRTLRAGRDTAEWAIDCSDVKRVVKHASAEIFDSWDANRSSSSPCQGHRFVSEVNLDPGAYKELSIDWLPAGPASLSISKMSLIDRDGKRTYHIRDSDVLFADTARFQYVEKAETSSLYRNMRVMPRAWLVPEVVTAKADVILRTLHTSMVPDGRAYDPRAVAFVEEPFKLENTGRTQPGTALVKALSNDRVEIDTSTKSASFLVLSDVYYPGWVASVDGNDTHVFLTNYALRGIAVPPGEHVVIFRYRPKPFYVGLFITFAALAGLTVFLVRARRKR